MEEKDKGEQVEKDAFGEPVKKEGESVPVVEVEKKVGGDEKLTPTQQIAELSRKLGTFEAEKVQWGETNKSKDENIRNMKDAIKRLEAQVGGKKDEGGEGEAPLFKDVKTSKDLTAEQKEEMTDTEIKQMDEIASLKQGMNELAKLMKKGTTKEGGEVVDVNTAVRDTAKELAGTDKAMANLIIESFKALKFSTEGLNEQEIADRVNIAATKVPNYKPPKEQAGGGGGKAAGGGGNDDPHGVDKIVEDVFKKREGGTFEL